MSAGPKFIRFFWPVLAALRDLGGSAKPREVVDLVVEMLAIPDDERAERTRSGTLRVENQVHWARNYLVWAGLLDGTKRGVWQLSNEGWALPVDKQDHNAAHLLFKRVRVERSEEWGQNISVVEDDDADPEQPPEPVNPDESADVTLTTAVRSTVLGLSPSGFEHLCKRLLTELGLTQLRTVGQAGDRGIDVEGHLRVNPVVSFRVGVQCKRYADIVNGMRFKDTVPGSVGRRRRGPVLSRRPCPRHEAGKRTHSGGFRRDGLCWCRSMANCKLTPIR